MNDPAPRLPDFPNEPELDVEQVRELERLNLIDGFNTAVEHLLPQTEAEMASDGVVAKAAAFRDPLEDAIVDVEVVYDRGVGIRHILKTTYPRTANTSEMVESFSTYQNPHTATARQEIDYIPKMPVMDEPSKEELGLNTDMAYYVHLAALYKDYLAAHQTEENRLTALRVKNYKQLVDLLADMPELRLAENTEE